MGDYDVINVAGMARQACQVTWAVGCITCLEPAFFNESVHYNFPPKHVYSKFLPQCLL